MHKHLEKKEDKKTLNQKSISICHKIESKHQILDSPTVNTYIARTFIKIDHNERLNNNTTIDLYEVSV